MLQKYKTDASLLFDEYVQEYTRDMLAIEGLLPKEGEQDQEIPEETDSSVVSIDESNLYENQVPPGSSGHGSQRAPDTEANKPEAPLWAKKLYRKIALVAHPDRSSEDFAKDRLNKIFLETSDAMSTGDFEKLLGFALELGIEASESDASMVPLLQKRVGDIKKEISDMEAKPEWLWGEGLGIHDMRAHIASLYLRRKGVNVKIEDLVSIIQNLENMNASNEHR